MNIKRNIDFIDTLPNKLDNLLSKDSRISLTDFNTSTNDNYLGALDLKELNALNVKYTDIVNNLVLGGDNVPLSAEQGKQLKINN